jgi:modulator of FtsH protease
MQTDYQVASAAGSAVSVGAHKVLRNTYMLLAITMLPTVVGAFAGLSLNFAWAAQHPIMFALGSLALMFGLFFGISANRNSALGVVLLLALTGLMGVLLGPILQTALHLQNGGQLVMLAAGGTGIIFMTLAGVATTSKRDFSFLGNFLMVGLILLIVAMLANLFFQVPALSLALSGVAVLLFSGFILYDVSRIVQGGETNYVMATLAIYLDIYNLFVNLLQLLMALMGERE